MPQLKSSTTYGEGEVVNNNKTFRERLVDLFQPHEYVRVINCDNEPVKWQYLPSTKEDFTFTPSQQKITTRGDVEVYLLNPGESEVLLGECAYIMIEVLYKQIVAKKTIERSPDQEPHMARNFNYTDALKQEEWINKIFLGKENPNFSQFETVKEPKEIEVKVEKQPKSKVERELKRHLSEQTS